MSILTDLLSQSPEYQKLLRDIEEGLGVISLYGMSPVLQAHFAAAVYQLGRPLVVIARDEGAADALAKDFAAFSGARPALLPARDMIFHNIDNVSREHEHGRLMALHSFRTGKSKALFSSPDALMLRTLPPAVLDKSALTIVRDKDYDLTQLCESLLDWGYVRADTVEGPGQFARRGGILDIFPSGSAHPLRAEFFGDTVDSLGYFDPLTQRRTENTRKADILPAREALPHLAEGGVEGLCESLSRLSKGKGASPALVKTLLQDCDKLREGLPFAPSDRYMPQIYDEMATGLSYIPGDALVVFADTSACLETAKGLEYRMGEDVEHLLADGVIPPSKSGYALSASQFRAACQARQVLCLDAFLSSSGLAPDSIIAINAKQLPSYGGSLDTAISDLESYLALGYTVLALSGGSQRAQNLKTLLEQRGLPCTGIDEGLVPGKIALQTANLSCGFEYPTIKVAAITEGQLSARRAATKKTQASKKKALSFSDLHPGDLVVHDKHGIGRFTGVERINVDGVWRDYIKIAFAGTDFVFVPATSLDIVSKYIGAGDADNMKLSKLGGTSWVKAKSRAKGAAKDLAEGLLKLYAARQAQPGFAFSPDDDWQRAFEEAFSFEETEDQLICTQEIKSDMQKPAPMDRLLCGDVGFGKTEVAFRAVMKCILSGKQAAILVPTTVLARQHYLSALERFSGHPVTVDMMSRFRTPSQQKETLRKLRQGSCDILIGTHRILQKDIAFKNLGLLVVDEEQRFGVSHKEKIKEMSHSVDVLTLTATPIPRTLNMALSGIRDMSVLEEPPQGRQPVQTFVLEHDPIILRDAIRKELARGGQVYYLHNRIDSIENVASELQKAFPGARIATAHGRMGEEGMSDIMGKMYAGEVDILVCTTIIETGVDIPNVNTLIIEDADHMGLAQLHQIRGRVGRSQRHAYAYLTYRRGKVLTEIAQKRLSSIREFAEFGSGFKIAMRDLEIRGAGNVLGAEQSGHMMSVGYDMYLRLLDEAAGELKGRPVISRTDCPADILVSAGLPQDYVSDASTRIDLYRRISLIQNIEDYYDMQDELLDRFGNIPPPAQALLDIALLRAKASTNGISEITQKGMALMFHFLPDSMEKAVKACSSAQFKGRVLLSAGERPYFTIKLRGEESPLDVAIRLIDLYIEP